MHVDVHTRVPDAWDAWVAALGAGSELGQAAAWSEVFREAYGLRTAHLVARDPDGACAGLLALARVRGLDGRAALVSLPYLDTAGVCARHPAATAALHRAALELARAWGCTAVELRERAPSQEAAQEDDEETQASRVGMSLPLPADEETLWSALPGKVRNQTRKARRSGLALRAGGAERLADFHAVHRVRMRELGSPVHAEAFFDAVARAFGERFHVLLACDGSRPVGALIAIRCGDALHVPWASTLSSENRRSPNNLIYWEALRRAVDQGLGRFEFGRSAPGGGTWRFKRSWGARSEPLRWTRLDVSGAAAPAAPPQASRVLETLSRVWRHLPPSVCDRVGPRVRPHIAS